MHSLPDDPTIITEDADALGSVTLAPPAMTGRSEADLAQAVAERLSAAGRRSAAETLKELRQAFPGAPLAARVAALRRGAA